MKLLIVDDERHVRDAIKLLIDWEKYTISSISEASNGQQAISLLENEHFDIVLTDMLMPSVNGVQLLEWIYVNMPHCKTIVISGYDDFIYVRHTIKYGGQDYILKPIDEAQLNEALNKAMIARNKELNDRLVSQAQSKKLTIIQPLYWKNIVQDAIVNNSVTPQMIQDLVSDFKLIRPPSTISFALLLVTTIHYVTLERFKHNRELLSYALANIANEILQEQRVGYAFASWNTTQDILLVFWNEHERKSSYLQLINQAIEKIFGHQCDFILGNYEQTFVSVKDAYQSCQNIMENYNLLQSSSRMHTYNNMSSTYDQTMKFEQYQEHIKLAILSQQPNNIMAQLNQWFNDLQKMSYISLNMLSLWQQSLLLFEAKCFDYDSKIKKPAPLSTQSQFFHIPFTADGQPDLTKWKQTLYQLFCNYSQQLSNATVTVSISQEIANYINQNYYNDVSLQTISDCFLLSREYISRKFKQDMNENISDYIAKVRISHAKQLLSNPQIKLHHICEQVGFLDDKYFSKVFKKLEGISPNQYRKEQQLLRSNE